MSRAKIFWIAAAIYGLAISLPLALVLSHSHYPQQSAASDTHGTNENAATAGSPNSNNKAVPQQENGHKPHDWGGPEAWLVYITGPLALFTGLLYRSTRNLAADSKQGIAAAKKAADAAFISANAARESADTAKDALHKLERPFVFIAEIRWEWHRDTGRPGRFWYSVHPSIENSGSTPTQEMTIRVARSGLIDAPIPDGFDFPFTESAQPSLIRPRGGVAVNAAQLLDDDLLAIQRGEKFFYIWGVITYRDIFDNTPVHVTRFCNEVTNVLGNPLNPVAPGDPTEKLTNVSIAFRIHHEHNSAN